MAGRWTVIAQRQYEELTPQGTFRQMVEVTFQITSGSTGMVKIPAQLFNEEYAREKIEDVANVMIGVESLSG
jgi:hypothetical protein